MTRVPRGYIAWRRQTKMRSFASNFRGAHLRLNRMITQQVKRAFVSSHRDRGRQKRDFRRLWITRINAATQKKLILNRKMIAQVAVSNPNNLYTISNKIKIIN
ncbi:unnamed protein product [Triticum turgidum subsp. durum]|uniref:Large ribosomal subunit protein bL20c n=1 Tax=Triticum turgidum subsp. durum TaxID=4567 RepID=A0A9R0QPI9_TRITD|nr:unnamed protein product [Triticum turgidum subsp. durum]